MSSSTRRELNRMAHGTNARAHCFNNREKCPENKELLKLGKRKKSKRSVREEETKLMYRAREKTHTHKQHERARQCVTRSYEECMNKKKRNL
jgi:hypothetical protein